MLRNAKVILVWGIQRGGDATEAERQGGGGWGTALKKRTATVVAYY
jgi:hypothetical protein